MQRRAEQLVLNIRALQLLSRALNLFKEELQAERLHPSPSVKKVNHFEILSLVNNFILLIASCVRVCV